MNHFKVYHNLFIKSFGSLLTAVGKLMNVAFSIINAFENIPQFYDCSPISYCILNKFITELDRFPSNTNNFQFLAIFNDITLLPFQNFMHLTFHHKVF